MSMEVEDKIRCCGPWYRLNVDRIERGMVELEVDCFCFFQCHVRWLGRIQNGGIIVLWPAAVVVCDCLLLVVPLVMVLV